MNSSIFKLYSTSGIMIEIGKGNVFQLKKPIHHKLFKEINYLPIHKYTFEIN